MRQEMTGFWDDRGISWTICNQSAPHSRQITTTTPHHTIFKVWMLFLTPNHQCQNTEGMITEKKIIYFFCFFFFNRKNKQKKIKNKLKTDIALKQWQRSQTVETVLADLYIIINSINVRKCK